MDRNEKILAEFTRRMFDMKQFQSYYNALEQILTAQPESECEWTPEDYDDMSLFYSGCGKVVSYDENPKEYVNYCQNCGRKINWQETGIDPDHEQIQKDKDLQDDIDQQEALSHGMG